jgi:hypothetical protein
VTSTSDLLITAAVGGGSILALYGVRALGRMHTISRGKTTQATILHIEKVVRKDPRYGEFDKFLRIQVAVPRPDGIEIVGVARAPWSDDPPKVGWTIPVSYVERLGTTTKVEIVGPATKPRTKPRPEPDPEHEPQPKPEPEPEPQPEP